MASVCKLSTTRVSFSDEHVAVAEAICRDEELSSGKVVGRTHEEVMEAARRALNP